MITLPRSPRKQKPLFKRGQFLFGPVNVRTEPLSQLFMGCVCLRGPEKEDLQSALSFNGAAPLNGDWLCSAPPGEQTPQIKVPQLPLRNRYICSYCLKSLHRRSVNHLFWFDLRQLSSEGGKVRVSHILEPTEGLF